MFYGINQRFISAEERELIKENKAKEKGDPIAKQYKYDTLNKNFRRKNRSNKR